MDLAIQGEIKDLAHHHLFTQQELARFVNRCHDFNMWSEGSLVEFWQKLNSPVQGKAFKKWAFQQIENRVAEIQEHGADYSRPIKVNKSFRKAKTEVVSEPESRKVLGMCPVASEKTVCCNLRTLDAVKNCGFGCSYCSIQTMYTNKNVVFDNDFARKLESIELDPNKRYHIGTGQSSDALMWGNKNGILDDVFQFARKWPNAIVEFKTKSKNVNHMIKGNVPSNVFCTWSLNPDAVIKNEEHLTAGLEDRLLAARRVADQGIIVGFHLHPMVFYQGWEEEYRSMIDKVKGMFKPEEVGMISFGTLTYPKPIIKKIRTYQVPSQILKMDMVPNPEGKMTYPDEIKNQLFTLGYKSFSQWHGEVFFYLCMEERKFWLESLGHCYDSNEIFESTLISSVSKKMSRS